MSTFDITQIVDRLVGQVEWVGETHTDSKRLEIMPEVEYLLEHLVSQLTYNIEALKSHPGNYSAEALGAKSKEILLNLQGEIEKSQEQVNDLVATGNQSQVEPLKSAQYPSDPKRKANT